MTATAVGVDIGGTKIAAAIVEWSGTEARVVGPTRRRPTPTRGAAAVAAATAALIEDVVSTASSAGPIPVGIGVAGLLRTDGRMVEAPNTAALAGVDVPAVMSEALGRSVVVGNDVNCAAVAEHRTGVGVGRDDLVMASLGTGIGGGMIIDGELRAGGHGLAAEVGHMVLDVDGPECPCGGRGCWERYASGSGLAALAQGAAADGRLALATEVEGDPGLLNAEWVVAAVRAGDEQASAVLREFSWWVARGLSVLAAVLDPELFVLGGGMVDAADLWLDDARSSFAHQVLGGGHRPPIAIEAAAHGPVATVVGAALLADQGKR